MLMLFMMLIIVLVIVFMFFFVYCYCQFNIEVIYVFEWDYFICLELVIWGVLLMIIIVLGVIIWISIYKFDFFCLLDCIVEGWFVVVDVKLLEVQVVFMDWKWLFIYFELGIVMVNEFVVLVDCFIYFCFILMLVMNIFYVFVLVGMIYLMLGMEMQLYVVINQVGVYDGMFVNYSGVGFFDMCFKFYGLLNEDFVCWVEGVKVLGQILVCVDYFKFEEFSKKEFVCCFVSVELGLWSVIVDCCVDGCKMCVSQMMVIDVVGGVGKGGVVGMMCSVWCDVDGGKCECIVVVVLCIFLNLLGLFFELVVVLKN